MRSGDTTIESHIGGREALLALAASVLGLGVHLRDGLYFPPTIAALFVAIILCAVATLSRKRLGIARSATARIFLAALAILQMIAMFFRPAGATGRTVPLVSQFPFHLSLCAAIVVTILIAVADRRIAITSFVLLLLIHGGIGVWKIRTAPRPRMDVFLFQVDSAHALSRGENPYAITFLNVYAPLTSVYGPGLVKDDRLQFGFPYPPLVLLFTAPAQLLLGDFRWAYLLAILGSGIMIVAMRPDKIGMLIAAILLFMPRTFYLLEIGFAEPLCAALLIATILCALRLPKMMPVMLGLLIASKQYLPAVIFLLPILYADRRLTRTLVVAIFFAAIVTLPLALWNFPAFWHSVMSLQFAQPYRADSASFLAWWGIDKPGWIGPTWVSFVAILIAIALCLWRAERTPAGFARAIGFCFFVFFVFSKQAFANYYYMVIAAMCVSVVAEKCMVGGESADKKIIGPCEVSLP